jgi:hypothetical protein
LAVDPMQLGAALIDPPDNGEEAYKVYEENLTQAKTLWRVIECLRSAF